MSIPASSHSAWAAPSALRAWSYGGLLAFLLLASAVRPTAAQVPLQLLHQADSTGQIVFEGRPLPPQTTVVLLRYPAERPHTLESAGIPRKKLARLVLTRLRSRDTTLQLVDEGKTPRRYSPTAESDRIAYVLARTPDSALYESYVNTGDRFAPGFDAIQSGRMTMGPVASREARRRFRAVFRLHRETVASVDTTSGTDSSDSLEARTGSGAGEGTSDTASARASRTASTEPPPQPEDDEGTSPVWTLLLGGLVGGLVGGGAAWMIFSDRLQRAEEDRDELRRKLRERKNQQFREATGTTLSASSESDEEASADTSSSDELERLRRENETLKRQIDEIKQYLQTLRDEEE